MKFEPVKEHIFLSLYRGILGMCVPAKVEGTSRRAKIARDKVQEVKTLLNVQDYFSGYFHSNGQREKGGGSAAMKRQKLNYRFHNPNTAEVTADYILKVFIEANMKKVEHAMQEAANKSAEEDKQGQNKV